MQPIVTVIIPVSSQHVQYLDDVLRSLKTQTVQVHQTVVVNDTGKPLRINDGVKVLNTRGRQGAAVARNTALEWVQTDFVTFLDADDLMINTAMETMLRAYASYPEASYIYGDAWTTSGDGKMLYYDAPLYDRLLLMTERNIHNVTTLIPTKHAKAIGGFDEVTRGWEDWDFYIRLGLAGFCGVKVPSPFILYRLHTGQNRAYSGSIAHELIREVRTRYGEYANGEKYLMGCCPSDAAAKQVAKLFAQSNPETPNPGDVLLEYVGRNEGSVPFRVNGRVYKGANSQADKFIKAKREDVATLIGLGVWRMVPEAALQAQKPDVSPIQARHIQAEPAIVTVPRMETASDLASNVTIIGCAKCNHIVNFHSDEKGCQALVGESVCGCKQFQAPMPKEETQNASGRATARKRSPRRNASPNPAT